MTKMYERLKNQPQTNISRSDLNPKERVELRTIKVQGLEGRSVTNPKGKFTTVYYLAGDERAAVEKFVNENNDILREIDFSKKDRVQQSVSREIYDLILDALDVRSVTKYKTVVLEERPDNTQWVIDRKKYENNPDRRYTIGETGSVRIPPTICLKDIYDQSGEIITQDDLTNLNIRGDTRQVLDYYRVCEDFYCQPTTTTDSKLAIKKL